jgi:hypothetical protein
MASKRIEEARRPWREIRDEQRRQGVALIDGELERMRQEAAAMEAARRERSQTRVVQLTERS